MAASAWALHAVMRGMASELGKYNIRCNTIAPGTITALGHEGASEVMFVDRDVAGVRLGQPVITNPMNTPSYVGSGGPEGAFTETAAQMHVQHRVKVIIGHFGQHIAPHIAPIVDEYVDAGILVDGRLDNRFAARRADFAHHGFGGAVVALVIVLPDANVVDHNLGPARSEQQHISVPQPASRTGNYRHAAIKSHLTHGSLLLIEGQTKARPSLAQDAAPRGRHSSRRRSYCGGGSCTWICAESRHRRSSC